KQAEAVKSKKEPVAAATAAAPPSSRKGAANPFLDSASSSKIESSPPATSQRTPSSGRGLQSTVTGLSSPSEPDPADAPPELDGSRKRRAMWFVAVALVLGAVAVTVGVMRSRSQFGNTEANVAPATRATAQPSSAPANATTQREDPVPLPSSS